MESKPMTILIIEDDVEDCEKCMKAAKSIKDIEIVGITDSDSEGLRIIKEKRPEGIVLDLELNNSKGGNPDTVNFIPKIRKMKLQNEPIIIVTTHVKSKRTHTLLHKQEVDFIFVKDQPNFSYEAVFNLFLNLRNKLPNKTIEDLKYLYEDKEKRISNCINDELDLIGISSKMVGRDYVYNAISYLIQNENTDTNVITYLSNKYKKSANTITNGIQNAIIHAWRVSAIEDLQENYKAKVNYETGVPTTMEFIYYYVEKVKRLI